MDIHPIAVAMPFMMLFIALELFWSWYRGETVYRFAIAVADLSAALVQRASTLLTAGMLLAPYWWLYEHGRMIEFDKGSLVMHAAAFLIYDLMYYLWHRWSHETTLGWATHVVHHQSEDYNFAMAIRLPISTTVSIAPFYLPLAFLGIPPEVLAAHISFNSLYQFGLHSEFVPKLGPLEWIFATPSHHRAHHAINERYVDRNYGGVLILWDRVFGSFVLEEEQPVFGSMDPVRNLDPLWANIHGFRFVWENVWRAPSVSAAWRGLWMSPNLSPSWVAPRTKVQPLSRSEQVKYDPEVSIPVIAYVAAHFMPVVFTMMALLIWQHTFTLPVFGGLFAYLYVSASAWNALTQARSWALGFERARLVLFGGGGGLALYLGAEPVWAAAVWSVTLVSLPAVAWAMGAARGPGRAVAAA